MLNARWMLLTFLFCQLPNVMGNDVYDLREGRKVWILETRFFEWTPRKTACRTGSALESALQPFSSFSPVCQHREWKTLSPTGIPIPTCPWGLTAMLAGCFYWPPVSSGEVIQLCQQEKPFWCAIAVSPLEDSANIAVVLPLMQRAPSAVRTYKSD